MAEPETYPFETLPDYMAPGMDLVFVGINPSTLSVQEGHYFFRKTNRFWPAFSRSVLSVRARAGLGTETLGPEHDAALLAFGIGFTDVVKVPSNNAAQVVPAIRQRPGGWWVTSPPCSAAWRWTRTPGSRDCRC